MAESASCCKWTKPGRELFVEVRSQLATRKAVEIARCVFYYWDKDQFLEFKVGPVVRRLIVTSGLLQKAGIPSRRSARLAHEEVQLRSG
jgi:hypothetical protein